MTSLNPQSPARDELAMGDNADGSLDMVFVLVFAMVLGALWSAPASAQSRAQLGPLCSSENTPADQQIEIDACNKIISLRVFSGAQLATVYFWRAVGCNKKEII